VRALERYNLNGIGVTLSHNQLKYVGRVLATGDFSGDGGFVLQDQEEFGGPVDRMEYLTGGADYFRTGYVDIVQFLLTEQAQSASS
jgi:cyclopropane fatty-acyl-phospholipid synthase-like methyltransferase